MLGRQLLGGKAVGRRTRTRRGGTLKTAGSSASRTGPTSTSSLVDPLVGGSRRLVIGGVTTLDSRALLRSYLQ